MHTRVVSSLAILLVGLTTTAYAGGYYHGDHYYAGNINGAPVYSGSYTQAPRGIYGNTINTKGKGAELFISNEGNHNKFGSVNLNFGRVKAKTKNATLVDNDSNIKYNEISTAGVGALTSIKSEGHGNRFFNINGNHARVWAITENIARNDIKYNEISTTAVGSYTGLVSDGSHNYFFTINGNKGSVRAKTLTESQDDIEGNKISTTAIGAQTYLQSTGHGNHSFALNFNKDYVGAVTNTWARDQIDDNTITTTAIGASLSVDDTKEGGHHFRGRYYSSSNFFGSLNLNRGDVSAQTNTVGRTLNGNTINTTAVGAATSITTHTGGH
jgi:hypothetical protein